MRIKHVWLHEAIESGKPISVRLVTVNHGDTEARVIESDVVVHAVPKNGKPPNEPFAGRIPNHPMMVLPSGKTLDHSPRHAGAITFSEIDDIFDDMMHLYCFAYVDYIDGSEPPIPRKTSCCRIFDPVRSEGASRSVLRGAFIQTAWTEMTEYNYAD